MVENISDPLTPMQMRFVEEYVKDGTSVAKAAARAGYSVKHASASGGRLMMNPRIKALITEANERGVKELGLTAALVLQELWKIAGANPGDVVTIDSEGEATVDPRKGAELAVTTVSGDSKKVKSVTVKTVKPADKVAALIKVGQYLGMFKDKVEVSGSVSLTDLIADSYREKPTATSEVEE